MLQKIDLRSILFLDIETVPASEQWQNLPLETQALWEEKSHYMRERTGMSLEESYSSAGIHAEFGRIVCIGLGYLKTDETKTSLHVSSFSGHDEHSLLQQFAALLKKQSAGKLKLLCAHNGKEFDFPYLCRRLLIHRIPLPPQLDIAGRKPWEVPHLDTMELWKFGDYKHYTSLKLLASVFGIPTPKDDISGSDVRKVYYEDGDLRRIDRYCRKDVITLAKVFLAYQGMHLEEVVETE